MIKEFKVIKPKLNSSVWILYETYGSCSFTKVKVIAKGTDIFIHSGCIDDCKCDDFRVPVKYEDYGVKWFKSLKEIRQKYKVEKIQKDYYEVIIDER